MAVWRRKPKQRVLIHSDQGSQFTSMDWAAFIRAHNLEHSMSRRGNCHDNAVAESFFSSLKRERIRRRTYKTREEARQDVFDYIEMFYNPVRKQVRNGMLSPLECERQQILKAEGLQKTWGHSLPEFTLGFCNLYRCGGVCKLHAAFGSTATVKRPRASPVT